MTPADKQRAYRERHMGRHYRMKLALEEIARELAGNEKPLAVQVRNIALEGLKR